MFSTTILQPNLYPQALQRLVPQPSASTTTRRAATRKKAGTISTSLAGSGYPMQIKIDFLCRDSILAAPLVLDLVLFLDLAQRAGMKRHSGVAQLLLQVPDDAPGLYPEHDLFIQLMKLKNTLRWLKGEDMITHLGQEYYD